MDDLVNRSGDLVKDLVNDCISRQAAIKALGEKPEGDDEWSLGCRNQWEWDTEILKTMPPAQQTTLTADDIETIRIHLSAFKEKLCNQGRWTEAAEYERLIQRLTGEGGQDETD